jgi:hypothetical protein
MEGPPHADGRIGAALIRVALALRADPEADFEKVVQKTAQDMEIDVNFLRQYVTKSLSTLRSAVAHAVPGGTRTQTNTQVKS